MAFTISKEYLKKQHNNDLQYSIEKPGLFGVS